MRSTFVKKMKKKNVLVTAGIAVFSLIVGIGIGFYATMNTMTPALDFHIHKHVIEFGAVADDAYASGDRAVATWTLGRYVTLLDEQQQAGFQSEWITDRDMTYSLMIQHARLAELHKDSDPQRSGDSIQLALTKASVIFGKTMTENELVELLQNRDLL
jgi:hypothetical protein